MERFHTEVMSAFSKRLKTAREAAGYATAKEFAETMKIEENRYRHWERGTAQPDYAMMCRLCRALDIEPNDLFPAALRSKKKSGTADTVAA
jgi:transcriptional regulator with XRE-family HTH domain